MSNPKQTIRRGTTQKNKSPSPRPSPRRSSIVVPLVGLAIAGLLLAIYLANHSSSTSAAAYTYQVGAPGPGQPAPAVHLAATDGSTFDLGNERGKTVLLYFQEGVGCEPCWNQITDIQRLRASFAAAHVDEIVSITTDPMDTLRQKVADEHVAIPVLSDPGLIVSKTYNANRYGMMGMGADGHTFILVGSDGRIRWRADYGGAPNYTMYVPVDRLLSDLAKATP
jgi:peroxiredoxin